VPAAVAKMDRGALGKEVAQDFNVRSACREVLSRMSAYVHPCTPSCIIRAMVNPSHALPSVCQR
jgi:hypothetical protein